MQRTFVDLFAGGGLASIGLTKAELTCILAADVNPTCLETLRANDPAVHVTNEDLGSRGLKSVLNRWGVSQDYDGLIWMSPPCQGVAECGARLGEGDERNLLLFKLSEAARGFHHAWLVFENVPGLKSIQASRVLYDRLVAEVAATGRSYQEWTLCALNCGLAQTRERIFIIVAPDGLTAPSQPEQRLARGRWRKYGDFPTLRHAIGEGFTDPDPVAKPLTEKEKRIISPKPGGNWHDTFEGRVYCYEKYLRARAEGRLANPYRLKPYRDVGRRLDWDAPGPTVIASWPITMNYRSHCAHPSEDRYLTNGECRRLMGIPDRYVIMGDHVERRRQIGNGVPPPMAELIARTIMDADSRQRKNTASSQSAVTVAATDTVPPFPQ